MAPQKPSATQALLVRAHSPNTAKQILDDSIYHRPLLVRATSPLPINARTKRRAARDLARKRLRIKPKPLSSQQRRALGLYDVPKQRGDGSGWRKNAQDEGSDPPNAARGHPADNYAVFEPLHRLWVEYMQDFLGSGVYNGGIGTAAKLAAAEYHGADMEVVRSRCVSRVGIRGIVVKDSKFVFEIITKRGRHAKMVPKEGTVFRVRIPAPSPTDSEPPSKEQDAGTPKEHAGIPESEDPDSGGKELVFELYGEQFRFRAADRSNKKFKMHFFKDL